MWLITALSDFHMVSPSTIEMVMDKIIRDSELTTQNAVLLQHEVHQLRIEN